MNPSENPRDWVTRSELVLWIPSLLRSYESWKVALSEPNVGTLVAESVVDVSRQVAEATGFSQVLANWLAESINLCVVRGVVVEVVDHTFGFGQRS